MNADQRRIDNRDPLAVVEIHDGAVFVARQVAGAGFFKVAAGIMAGGLHGRLAGTAHFFEHLPFGETAHFKDGGIEVLFREHGGHVNAFTTHDMTVFCGEVANRNYAAALTGVAELMCRPVLTLDRMNDEAKTIAAEWAMRASQQLCQRRSRYRQAALGSSAPAEVIGTRASIEAMRLEDLKAFYDQYYVRDNLIVYMQGDIDPGRMIAEARPHFTLPRGKATSPAALYELEPQTITVPVAGAEATHAAIIFAGPSGGQHPHVTALRNLSDWMLCAMEGGLMREAREARRLVYAIESDFESMQGWTFSFFEFDAFPENVREVAEIIMRHVATLVSSPDRELFEMLRKTAVIELAEKVRHDPEEASDQQVCVIGDTGIVASRQNQIYDLIHMKVEDLQSYVREYWVEKPVSVVYEGAINPGLPDHDELAEMRMTARGAARPGAKARSQSPSELRR